ncbi:MAG: ComF family protein [Anaerolineae bacterium]|nr:ComF family protein [Anaerolineae bacterium]
MKGLAGAGNQNMSQFAWQVQSVARAALDLLFPPRCAVCGRVERKLCADCVADFHPIGDSFCPTCGEPQLVSNICGRCAANPPAFEYIRSAYRYEAGLRKAIHVFKYNGRRGLAAPLADAMVQVLPKPLTTVVICPVPLYPARQAQRGYNQARLLAEELAHCWNLTCLPEEALRRIRSTSSQVGLDYTARQSNVSNAFAADPALVGGNAILLVDDVCTTGATMNACAKALLAAGATFVAGVSLARASSDGQSGR